MVLDRLLQASPVWQYVGREPVPVVQFTTPLAYMDVDLSTDLAAVLPLVAPLISGWVLRRLDDPP